MLELVELFLVFFKIGLFSFGGGYAMIPMMQADVIGHGWLTSSQFAEVVAIADMTPGPVSVNAATYVGFVNGGVIGGLVASAGVVMPSLLLVLLIAKFFFKYQDHPIKKSIFNGLRPVVAGLVVSAALVVGQTSLLRDTSLAIDQWLAELVRDPLKLLSPLSILIFIAVFVVERKCKIHPLILIGAAALAGGVLFTFGPAWF